MQAFRMYGRIIEINRYSVTYEEQLPPLPDQEPEEPETIQRVEYAPTKEEADAIAERTGAPSAFWKLRNTTGWTVLR